MTKIDRAYKEKDAIANSWNNVVSDVEFLNDVNEARVYWENLRKRYNKKRNELKKADKSGTSFFEKEKARKAFQPYAFLQWIDRFIGTRSSRNNLPKNFSHIDTQNNLMLTLL